MSYTTYYAIVAGLMLAALLVFLFTVREPAWSKQMQEDSVRLGIEETAEDTTAKRGLTKSEKISLILILASIALWYFGYNAVTSKYSVYAPNVLLMSYSNTMLIAQGCAIASYIPAGLIASRIGRKKTILAGVLMLSGTFFTASFIRAGSPTWLMYILFAFAGISWAVINVNSFPMVVEMCSGADVGKYTGYYYTASMAAQTLTPMLSGLLMDKLGLTSLFPYATVFVSLAFVTMLPVMHGDTKLPHKTTGSEA
jgi:MFS family permease